MRHLATIVFTSLVLLLSIPASAFAQARTVFWERWDVRISNVDTGRNQFDVTEQYVIDFTGTFRFGTATIPLTNLEDIRNIRVWQDGRQLNQQSCGSTPGTYCLQQDGGSITLTYNFFAPISDGQGRFEIRYTVVGALRIYPEGDQLWWIAIPGDHYGFPIGSSVITVEMPPGFGPREGVDPVETYGVPANVAVSGTVITATASRQLGGNESFEIRVQYPHDPSARVAAWQTGFDQQRAFDETTRPLLDVGLLMLSLLAGIGGPLGMFALWYTRGRDPGVGPVPTYLSEPPSALPPAVVGTLLDERADTRDVIATILDVARRGYLVLEESQEEGLFGLKSSTFRFKRTDRPLDDLRPFERRVVERVFQGAQERTLDSLRNRFYAFIPKLQNDLYTVVVAEGLFKSSPNTTRAVWSGLGVLLLVLAFVVGMVALGLTETFSGAVLCLPLALGLSGLVAFVIGQAMPAKTQKGAEEAARWRAFGEYLRNLERYSSIEEAADRFDDFLPYAIAFGIDRSWIQRFSKINTVPVPPWYFPTYMGGPYGGGFRPGSPMPERRGPWLPGELASAGGGGSLDDLSRGMAGGLNNVSRGLTSMLNSASSAMTSRPRESGGSSGRWSSGGRGWSGGGRMGGGGSGGGSRGFG